ncbi:MAG TPA: DUF3106 domain-containing protein, partial [Candidatus Omnitrophota bacterium]|nr:DUF3106 domain-containing protein [Candidatus Omnitrophota bacterium]
MRKTGHVIFFILYWLALATSYSLAAEEIKGPEEVVQYDFDIDSKPGVVAGMGGEYHNLSDQQKKELLIKYRHFRSLSKEEQEKLKNNWRKFGGLSQEQRAQL